MTAKQLQNLDMKVTFTPTYVSGTSNSDLRLCLSDLSNRYESIHVAKKVAAPDRSGGEKALTQFLITFRCKNKVI